MFRLDIQRVDRKNVRSPSLSYCSLADKPLYNFRVGLNIDEPEISKVLNSIKIPAVAYCCCFIFSRILYTRSALICNGY
jgi:hypothetical protein